MSTDTELDKILEQSFSYQVVKSNREIKQALLAWSAEREKESYKKGYIDGGLSK